MIWLSEELPSPFLIGEQPNDIIYLCLLEQICPLRPLAKSTTSSSIYIYILHARYQWRPSTCQSSRSLCYLDLKVRSGGGGALESASQYTSTGFEDVECTTGMISIFFSPFIILKQRCSRKTLNGGCHQQTSECHNLEGTLEKTGCLTRKLVIGVVMNHAVRRHCHRLTSIMYYRSVRAVLPDSSCWMTYVTS